MYLDQTAKTQVFLDDDVINGCHNEADLGGIGGAGEVGVDLLGLVLVQADESVEDVVAGQSIVVTTFEVREVVLHGADWELLLESIDLVQEEDDGGLDEPAGVADRIEQSQSFLHTIDSLILEKKLVVLGNGNKKQDRGDVLEAMNPLLSLRSLSTYVEHSVCEVADDEGCLGDTSSLDTRSKDILIVGHVITLGDTLDVVEVVSGRIVQLILS